MVSSYYRRLLVVDDIIDNLALLQCILELAGYQVSTVTSGKAAIATVQHDPPGLILLDVMMPDLNGIEVTRQLRQHKGLSSNSHLAAHSQPRHHVGASAGDWGKRNTA